VILKPFKSSVRPDAPNAMQGAPVTVQVTSSTSLLFSTIVSVAVTVPLIFAALPLPALKQNIARTDPRIPTLLIWFSFRDRFLPSNVVIYSSENCSSV
jgi:hypothetical protein